MSTLYLINYNNYYNRKVKKENSVSAYASYLPSGATALSNINFNPNDGINTEQIVNWNYNTPDYVVVVDNSAISSRWFVIEAQRTRAGQLHMILHRDVIVDNYDDVVDAPMFIEKATLNSDNPLIFNSEDMTYNKIKDAEELLMDETECPWLVGYCTSKTDESISANIDIPVPADLEVAGISNYTYYGAQYKKLLTAEFVIKYYNSWAIRRAGVDRYDIYNIKHDGFSNTTTTNRVDDSNTTLPSNSLKLINTYQNSTPPYPSLAFRLGFGAHSSELMSSLKSSIGGIKTDSEISTLLNQAGTVIHDTTSNKYYKVKIVESTGVFSNYATTSYPDLRADFLDVLNEFYAAFGYSSTVSSLAFTPFSVSSSYKVYAIDFDEIPSPSVTRTISISNNRYHLTDAPYDMFCMPYSDDLKIYKNGTLQFTSSKIDAFFGALALMRKYSAAGTIYDVQLLPYCPVRYMIQSNGNFDVKDYEVSYVTDTSNNKTAVICYPSQSSFTLNILNQKSIDRPHDTATTFVSTTTQYSGTSTAHCDGQAEGYIEMNFGNTYVAGNTITNVTDFNMTNVSFGAYVWTQTGNILRIEFQTSDSGDILTPYTLKVTYDKPVQVITYHNSIEVDTKVESETSMYRLCSPNYASSFDFNLAKNQGMDFINVDCTYKPYTPYIHLNPNFKNLYGEDFNDPRGLICGGDFSIPSDADHWATYELQNKNYQLAFDRQIQSLDLNNNVQSKLDKFNAISGTITGTIAGATTGAMAGGVYGAVAGAVVGGASSAIGGAMDVYYNNLLRTDARDLRIDQFNYSLGNIQALPYTLNKVSSFNFNNKIFPILEHYTCTETEKNALINKLKYNGMTVMAIGRIVDYIRPEESYIKGRLIRLESIPDDFHMVNSIADELYKGVYI